MLFKEQEIIKQKDKPVQERVAERLKTHIGDVTRSKREHPTTSTSFWLTITSYIH